MEEQILSFFRAFADLDRLRMAALLSEDDLTLEEIATRLQLRPVEIPRHLAQLEKLGLVSMAGSRYHFNAKALERLSREVLSRQDKSARAVSNDENASDFEQTVLRNYSLPDGRLKEIPSQGKKRMAILRHIAQAFEPGAKYTEKQVNEICSRYHPDFSSLRRYLYDSLLLNRASNGSVYWRNLETAEAGNPEK